RHRRHRVGQRLPRGPGGRRRAVDALARGLRALVPHGGRPARELTATGAQAPRRCCGRPDSAVPESPHGAPVGDPMSPRPVRAVRAWWDGARPAPGTFWRSAGAGVPGAVGGVPDGMATATLVGVNPIHGLYATAIGRIAGGLTVDSRLMIVTTT